MTLQRMPLEKLLSLVARAEPLIGGRAASLLATRFGIAMVRMAFAVTAKHRSDNDLLIERLDSLAARLNAFAAVMMAIENSLGEDEVADLDLRTQQNRSDLRRRHDVAVANLRSSHQARERPDR